MSELLKEAEISCTNILQILEKLEIFPKEKTKEATNKMANILRDISISKKKIMMKSAKGAELSEKVKKSASGLEKTLKDVSRHQDSKMIDYLSDQLSELESNVSNVTIYWRSFEAVLT
jgi:hypothetical protein